MLNYRVNMPAAPALIQLEPDANLGVALDPEGLAWLFKALSDPARLRILHHLASGIPGCCGDGVCGCDLEEVTGLTQPTVSHHMKCLASAGLVTAEKRGKWMYYALDPNGFAVVRRFLGAFEM